MSSPQVISAGGLFVPFFPQSGVLGFFRVFFSSCVSPFGPFYRLKWHTPLPFHILELVKSLPFYLPEALERNPFREEPPCISHNRWWLPASKSLNWKRSNQCRPTFKHGLIGPLVKDMTSHEIGFSFLISTIFWGWSAGRSHCSFSYSFQDVVLELLATFSTAIWKFKMLLQSQFLRVFAFCFCFFFQVHLFYFVDTFCYSPFCCKNIFFYCYVHFVDNKMFFSYF